MRAGWKPRLATSLGAYIVGVAIPAALGVAIGVALVIGAVLAMVVSEANRRWWPYDEAGP